MGFIKILKFHYDIALLYFNNTGFSSFFKFFLSSICPKRPLQFLERS